MECQFTIIDQKADELDREFAPRVAAEISRILHNEGEIIGVVSFTAKQVTIFYYE